VDTAPAPGASDAALLQWAEERADTLGASPKALDLTWALRFTRARGFSVRVVRAHNLPNAALSAAVVSLAPPASFYKRAGGTADQSAHLVAPQQADSELRSPAWAAPAHVFKMKALPSGGDAGPGNPLDDLSTLPHLAVVIDVRHMPRPSSGKVASQGFALLPVFAGPGYIASGAYRLPLLKLASGAEPSPGFLEQVASTGVKASLAQAKQARQIKVEDGASVEVLLLDEARAGEWDAPNAPPESSWQPVLDVLGGDRRALERYKAKKQSKLARTQYTAQIDEKVVAAKFANALGFDDREE